MKLLPDLETQLSSAFLGIWRYSYLHSNDSIDKEEHDDQEGDVGQSLKTLDEGPEQSADALSSTQQFDESHHTKKPEEVH